MPDVRALTADYERWLGDRIPLDRDELRRKHDELAHDEYRFLRGTYYLWLVRAATEVPDAFGHVARAARRRPPRRELRHLARPRPGPSLGVNDLDELARRRLAARPRPPRRRPRCSRRTSP